MPIAAGAVTQKGEIAAPSACEDRPGLSPSTQSIDVAIIGAGPYGLSVAAHLLDAGIDARVFGDPMAGWRHHMPKGMYLKSTFEASSLSAPERDSSLADYCAATGTPVPDDCTQCRLACFIDYGDWFQKRRVGDVGRIEIRNVAVVPNGFRLSLEDGEDVSARTVIVASDISATHTLPTNCALLPTKRYSLPRWFRTLPAFDFSRFSGRV